MMEKTEINLNYIGLISLFLLTIFLVGCGSKYEDDTCVMQTSGTYTPCHTKHAKRGYNKPYTIKGIRYTPQPHYEINEIGIASYYGGTDVFHGRPTSTGKIFDKDRISAAHKTAALPCVIWVTNLENGRRIKVEVNDRGPFIDGRVIDVSRKTAQMLGFHRKGTAKVHIETAVPETLMLAQGHLHDDVIQLAEVSQHDNIAALQNVNAVSDMPPLDSTIESVVPTVPVPSQKSRPVARPKKNLEDIILLASQAEDLSTVAKSAPIKAGKAADLHQPSLDSLIHQVMAEDKNINVIARSQLSPANKQIQKTVRPSKKLSRTSQADLIKTTKMTSNAPSPQIMAGQQGYFVHAASFKSKAETQNTYQRLQKIFTSAAVRRESIQFGSFKTYRILVGPLRSRQDAKVLLQKVSSSGLKDATVIYNG